MNRWTLVLGFLCCVLVVPAHAATLYMSPGNMELGPGDTVTVAVRLDTDENECINVVDGVIEYDPAVQPIDISRGQSIFPLWVEEPTIDSANNRITFAGGIPNGYCGRIQGDPRLTNEILKIVFQSPGFRIGFGDENPTTTVVWSDETTAYLNDGRGTVAPLLALGTTFVRSGTPSDTVRNEWTELVNADVAQPEEFSVTLHQDENIFGGKYYIVFNTTDKQTGIAYYEVIEESSDDARLFNWGRVDAPWQKTRSPYVLKDQGLNSTVRVKAIDKAGNEYIATLVPEESLRAPKLEDQVLLGMAVAGGMIVLLLLGFLIWRAWRLRAQRQVDEDQTEEEVEYEYEEEEAYQDEEYEEDET